MKVSERKVDERLSGDTRKALFSYIPRQRLIGMEADAVADVLDAFGRGDLAREAFCEMGIPLPIHEVNEPDKLTVLVVDESYTKLYEVEVEDHYTKRGTLSDGAAREIFDALARPDSPEG